MITLKSSRLRVQLSEQGEIPNTGFRFDHAGYISDVVLDGDRYFCTTEPRNLIHPSTGGRGLCCEYKADYSAEAADGEYYPKFGIGRIQKDGAYCFHKKYDHVDFFPVSCKAHDETSAEFVTEAVPCLGYAAQMHKKISVSENILTMEVSIRNTGEKEIVTEEYCHNFLSIDGMAISPAYHLDLPALNLSGVEIPNMYPTPCNFSTDEKGIGFRRVETEVSLAEIPLDSLTLAKGEPFVWRLVHTGEKAWVEGSDEIRPTGFTLWATDHIVSPEIIQTIRVLPGETVEWKRTWKFEAE